MTTTALPTPTPRCAGPHRDRWFSSDPDDQEFARWQCGACAFTAMCADLGRGEGYGVWAGEDRSVLELIEPPVAEHQPDRNCYARGCRRPECRAANARFVAAHRAKSGCYRPGDAEVSRFEQLALGVTA